MKLRPFKILPIHRQGIVRAAEWHDRQSKIFRNAVAERLKYKIGHGEMLWRAEEHEDAARELRELLLRGKNANQ